MGCFLRVEVLRSLVPGIPGMEGSTQVKPTVLLQRSFSPHWGAIHKHVCNMYIYTYVSIYIYIYMCGRCLALKSSENLEIRVALAPPCGLAQR